MDPKDSLLGAHSLKLIPYESHQSVLRVHKVMLMNLYNSPWLPNGYTVGVGRIHRPAQYSWDRGSKND